MRTPLFAALVLVGCGVSSTPEPTPTFLATRRVTARQLEPNLMIVLDRSSSMAPHLADVKEALPGLLSESQAIRTGYSELPADGACGVAAAPLEPIGNSSAAIVSRLPEVTAAGDSPMAQALTELGRRGGLLSIDREDFVLLLTSGAPGCAPTVANAIFDTSEAITALRQKQIRTIVIGVGAQTREPALESTLNLLAQKGGFTRTCPFGTDAECGSGATCSAGSVCSRAFFQADDATELQTVFAQLTATAPASAGLCRFQLERAPVAGERLVVSINGLAVESGPDTWSMTGAQLEFLGTACGQLEESSTSSPVDVSVAYFP